MGNVSKVHNKSLAFDPVQRQAIDKGLDPVGETLSPPDPVAPAQRSQPVTYNTTAAYRRTKRRPQRQQRLFGNTVLSSADTGSTLG